MINSFLLPYADCCKVVCSVHVLSHWGRHKMATILQIIFSNQFFLMKIIVFWMKLKFVPEGAINNKSLQIMFWSQIVTLSHYLNGLVQERHNSSALALGLRLSCTDSMWPNNGLVRWCTCVNRPWWVPCFCLLLVWSYRFHPYPSGLHQWHWGNMSSYHFSENGLCNHNKAKHNQMCPDSKVHGDNVRPTWGRQATGGPHVGPINFAIQVYLFQGMHSIHFHMFQITWLCFQVILI